MLFCERRNKNEPVEYVSCFQTHTFSVIFNQLVSIDIFQYRFRPYLAVFQSALQRLANDWKRELEINLACRGHIDEFVQDHCLSRA